MYSVSAFLLIQYPDSLARSHVFSIPMWLLCNWSSICFCKAEDIIIHLSFIATLFIIARSCLLASTHLKKVPVHHCSVSILSLCVPVAFVVLHLHMLLISSIYVQTGMSTAVLTVCVLMLIPAISWCLFSLWL